MLWFKHITLLLLCCIVTAVGCIPQTGQQQVEQPQPAPGEEEKQTTEASQQPVKSEKQAESKKIATLAIKAPKKSYEQGEAIPLKLTLKTGFDLLMKKYSAEMLLSRLIVKSEDGTEIKFQRRIVEPAAKILKKDGKRVECQPGAELKKGAEKSYSIDNLLEYFPITQPGVYSVQLNLKLPIYKDSFVQKPPQILEFEEQIAEYKKNPRFPENKKQMAIAALQEEIKMLEKEGVRPEMFVVLSSWRGDAEIQSNLIEITIQ